MVCVRRELDAAFDRKRIQPPGARPTALLRPQFFSPEYVAEAIPHLSSDESAERVNRFETTAVYN